MSRRAADRPTRRALLTGVAVAAAAPAHPQLGDLLKSLTKAQPPQPTPGATPPPPQVVAGVQSVVPRGYSEKFVPIRGLIAQGRYSDALERFAPPTKPSGTEQAQADDKPAATAPATPAPIVSDPFLANVEMGLLEFESGAPDQAVVHLRLAEDSQTADRDARGVKAAGHVAGDVAWTVFGKVSGQEGLTRYHPLDHEHILQLNYLSLAYLLQGERRCYNITRRCIEEQAALKAKFEVEIEEYKAKLAQQTDDKSKVSDSDHAAFGALGDQFRAYDHQASRVPNAYVNPLGDYLAGVIQEIVSHEQPSLRDNSRISYQNAVKLCGGSAQLSLAATAMARPRPPAHERILHVIVGEGFSPSRDVLSFGLNLKGQIIPVRVPIFTPVPSPVERISVHTASGLRLATLDPIGDFEAIRLRDQQDRIPEIMVGVLASSLGSYLTGQATKNMGLFGAVLHAVRDANATPDTRSWLSLPRRFHVARIALPPSVHEVTLAAYDAQGRKLASQTAPVLASETQSILYARATQDGFAPQAARRLWIEGQLEETPS